MSNNLPPEHPIIATVTEAKEFKGHAINSTQYERSISYFSLMLK